MYWNGQPWCACARLRTHTHTRLYTHFLTCFGEEVHLGNFERLHCRSAWCKHFSHYTTNKARGTSAIWHLKTVNLIRKSQNKGYQVPLIIHRKLYIWPSLPDRPYWVFKKDVTRFSGRRYSHSNFAPPQTSSCCNNNNFFLILSMLKATISHSTAEWSCHLFCFLNVCGTELGGFA